MGDEFQAGLCSGNWWNQTKSGVSMGSCSSPCSTALNDIGSSFGWASEARSSCEETTASVSDSSMVFQQTQKTQASDTVVGGGGGGGGGGGSGILLDSTFQMMGFGPSSLTMDWNQSLLRGSGRVAETTNFNSMLQVQDDLSSRPNFRAETGMESPPVQSFSGGVGGGGGEDSILSTVSSQGIPTGFPSYACNSSSLLQGLFDTQETQIHHHHHQRFPFETNPSPNYRINTGEFSSSLSSPSPSPSPSWPKFPDFLKSSAPKQKQQHHLLQPSTNQLHFSNNTPFWNASVASMNDARSTFFPSPETQYLTPMFEMKPNCRSNLNTTKSGIEEVRDSGSVVKKNSNEPPYKRPRIETPSPLPTFKVRKEKLGDRITALQQLVSPFGKTDTASVLLEAIEYIKFLHDQVSVLSTPYLKNGAPIQHQQSFDKSKDGEGPKQDLRSRGLCLVPISSTFPVTNETAADFWTPTFGGTYR
ncbi:transcription factor bHLH112-like isoform X2 [Telopea speciosissima]|uniref:transcription factor bHLH112-like isoform X2 n=1 Tax=Telopea speciosissima TaxID=54955 RepID=UPI001CC3C3BB|nr:transcription factor bHLH112-like isoform X2 [Telopea speciosissima]